MTSTIKVLVACALSVVSSLSVADVNVVEGYVRAVPPGQMNSAAFMQLHNTSDTAVAIVGGKSTAAKHVELHTHTNDNGVMQMRQVERFDISAKGSISLQPGGHHIMLIGLENDLLPGSNVNITLEFADGSQQTVELPVQKVMPMQHGHHHHH